MNPPRAMALRPAHPAEARVMATLSRQLIEAGLAWRYTPARMVTLIQDPDTVALVAHDGLHLQGFAVMQFGDTQAHLVLLCVQPARQRQGTGRKLVEWLLASARVAGITSIQLELRADNPGALDFYSRLGFAETQQLAGYYDGRIGARRMRLVLQQPNP